MSALDDLIAGLAKAIGAKPMTARAAVEELLNFIGQNYYVDEYGNGSCLEVTLHNDTMHLGFNPDGSFLDAVGVAVLPAKE